MMQIKKSRVHQNEVYISVDIEGMKTYSKWIEDVSVGHLSVFISFNAPFDWKFINWYFHIFLGRNPFCINAINIKSYYKGFFGSAWIDTSSSRLPSRLKPSEGKKHNALDDANTQAVIFTKLLSASRSYP